MFRELLVSLLLCVILVNGEDPPSTPDTFIINGPEANIQDFPYALSLRRNGIHVGGGAIITTSWAMSVAHILLGCPPAQLTIRAGSSERLLGGSLHNANSIIINNGFNPIIMDNNIAMIGVLEPFVFSATVSGVSLDIQGTMVLPGTSSNHLGFGVIMPATNNISPILRYNTMIVQDHTACQESLGGFMEITSNMLCTISSQHNPCHGDFGGPLVANGVLIGLASWNPFCSNAGYSTAFTRIASSPIRSFIRGIVGF